MLTLPHDSPRIDTVETSRLRLRAHRVEDLPAVAAMWADPLVVKHLGIAPLTQEDSWSRILRYAGHWAMLGFGYWAIEEKSTGSLVGDLGFADYLRNIQPSIAGRPEMGWILSPSMHGRGYATEAVRAALAWGASRFRSNPPVCIIEPANLASLRVAEKCGFRETARTTYRGDTVVLLAHQAS